jgi:transcriptional regulator
MYIPRDYAFTDTDEIIAFMKRFPFGIVVSANGDAPVATHLPFHIDVRDSQVILSGHMAKPNTQSKTMENQTVMVIFSGPHAYISPSHYQKENSVPTWNYIAVHAYGKCCLIDDAAKSITILEQTIMQHEPGYVKQWHRLPEEYKSGLSKGITPFEISVSKLEAVQKLSQDKTSKEQANIIDTLHNSPCSNDNDIAEYMTRLLQKSF